MHQVSRRWAKRTIAAPFRACGSSAETILSGRVRDMHDVLKVLFAIAGAFAYWKAIFTSGGTIATAVSWVLGVPHEKIYGFYEPVFNCSITRLIFSRGRVSLSNFNDTAHLQLLSQQLGESLVTYR